MSAPDIVQFTDEISYTWAERHITLVFNGLHPTDSGRVVGFITVFNPDRRNGSGPERLYWQSVTLTTASDRKTLGAKLDALCGGKGTWEADIDRTFMDAYERFTRVPEAIILDGVADDELEVAMLVAPVLPAGLITLFLADQGSTKSYLMLYLAECIALGRDTVFGPPARSGPVVFFDWEVDAATANRRVALICRGLGVEPSRHLHYVDMSTRGRIFDHIGDMRHMVERIRPELVIIDSLTFATGADLNSAEYAAPTMSAVGSLGEGVTKLISAHPNKAGRNASTEDISVIGSTLFEYRARAIWHMKRDQAHATRFGVSMTPRKQFDGPPQKPLAYTMEFDNVEKVARFGSARLSDMPDLEASTMTTAERIRRALGKAGRLDTRQLSESTGIPQESIKAECNRMFDVFPLVAGGGRGNPTIWALKHGV